MKPNPGQSEILAKGAFSISFYKYPQQSCSEHFCTVVLSESLSNYLCLSLCVSLSLWVSVCLFLPLPAWLSYFKLDLLKYWRILNSSSPDNVHVSERHCFGSYSAAYVKWVTVLILVPDNWCLGHISTALETALDSECPLMRRGGEISQNRATQNPVNRQSPETELVMAKGPKTGDWFGRFTGGKRKIWDLSQHTKLR